MGWVESPPLFCAVSETITDIANARIQQGYQPTCSPIRAMVQRPTRHQHQSTNNQPLLIANFDVYVDDFIAIAQGPLEGRNKPSRLVCTPWMTSSVPPTS